MKNIKQNRPYPLIEFARSIQKNTAEFTLGDFAKYMKWWMKQPQRKDLLAMSKKYTDAIKSRVPVDVEQVDDSIADEEREKYQEHGDIDAVVAELQLTQTDVDALLWGITQLLEQYDFSQMIEIGVSLVSMKEGLEGVE